MIRSRISAGQCVGHTTRECPRPGVADPPPPRPTSIPQLLVLTRRPNRTMPRLPNTPDPNQTIGPPNGSLPQHKRTRPSHKVCKTASRTPSTTVTRINPRVIHVCLLGGMLRNQTRATQSGSGSPSFAFEKSVSDHRIVALSRRAIRND